MMPEAAVGGPYSNARPWADRPREASRVSACEILIWAVAYLVIAGVHLGVLFGVKAALASLVGDHIFDSTPLVVGVICISGFISLGVFALMERLGILIEFVIDMVECRGEIRSIVWKHRRAKL